MRLSDGSVPGKRSDKFKVGLVVEGGGMRGVVTGAALQAMHDLGMRCASQRSRYTYCYLLSLSLNFLGKPFC